MADQMQQLIHRNIQEILGEGAAKRRRAAISALYTDDCVVYVPPGAITGHDAINNFAGDLRATHPHFVYTPTREPQSLHNAVRLNWGSGPRSDAFDYTAEDFAIFPHATTAPLYPLLSPPPTST